MKETYEELQKRQQQEISDFPCFYAFSDSQFQEGMKKLGVKSEEELCQSYVTFLRKSDREKWDAMWERHKRELDLAMRDDDFAFEAIRYELGNHEYIVTFDPRYALGKLNLTPYEVVEDERLYHIFKKAEEDYLSWQREHNGW